MENENLYDAIESLWDGSVDNIDFDIKAYQITVDISTANSQQQKIIQHHLVFEGVSAFCFINDVGERRYKIGKMDWIELSESHYYPRESGYQNHMEYRYDKPGFPIYYANPNFYLELWSSVFLIEAQFVTIDGIQYKAI